MSTVDYGEKWCKLMDRAIAAVINRKRGMLGILTATYLHQPVEEGGVALKSVAAAQLYHQAFAVYKALNSPDRHCASVSRAALRLGCLPGTEVITDKQRMTVEIRIIENKEADEWGNDPTSQTLRDDWTRWIPVQVRAENQELLQHCRELYDMDTPKALLQHSRGVTRNAMQTLPRQGENYNMFIGRTPAPYGHPWANMDRAQMIKNANSTLGDTKRWWAVQNYLAFYPHSEQTISDAQARNKEPPTALPLHPMIALEHRLSHITAYADDSEHREIWTDASIDKASMRMSSAYWTATEEQMEGIQMGDDPFIVQLAREMKAKSPESSGYILTNNTDDINAGEMKAVILALTQFARVKNITLYTDSAYVMSVFKRLKQMYMPHGQWCPPARDAVIADKHGVRSREMRMLQELVTDRWHLKRGIEICKVHAHLIDPNTQADDKHERRWNEMEEAYEDRMMLILKGNRMADVIAKEAAAKIPVRKTEPQREQSRFGDAYALFMQVDPKLKKHSPFNMITDFSKVYKQRIERDWEAHWRNKQRTCAKENKPIPIRWTDDDTVDKKHMNLLWKHKQHKQVELHNFRDRMLRKELPEKQKLHRRITDERQGEFWAEVYNKRGLISRYSTPACPMKCGMVERDNHFLHECPDQTLTHDDSKERALAQTICETRIDNTHEKAKQQVQKLLTTAKAYESTRWMNGLKHSQWLYMGVLPKKLRKTLSSWRVRWKGNITTVLREVQANLITHARDKWRARCKAMIEEEREQKKAEQRDRERQMELDEGEEEDRRLREEEYRQLRNDARRDSDGEGEHGKRPRRRNDDDDDDEMHIDREPEPPDGRNASRRRPRRQRREAAAREEDEDDAGNLRSRSRRANIK
jgi:ribonuclease HI